MATCQRCGDLIDLLETGKAGRKRRADVKMCDACRKYKRSTRHGVSPHVLAKRDGFDCKLCGEPVDFDLPFPDRRSPSVDHVFPYAHGGSHELSNLQLAHLWCNHKKSNRVA